MRKKFVQLAGGCLAAALVISAGIALPGASASNTVGEQVIRVGIYFGSDTLPGANLGNETGRGFRLGYFDGGNEFVPLAYTEETKISVAKTENVYYGSHDGYTSYHDSPISDISVGCYHVEIPGAHTSFDQARDQAQNYEDGFVSYHDGSYYVRVGSYLDRSGAAQRQSELQMGEVVGTSEYAVNVISTGTDRILFQYDDDGSGTGLGVMPNAGGDGDYTTWFRNISWRGGFRYERIGGGNLTIVNMVELDDYVKGVVPHEMSNSWPLEALKAQAVCARTYALNLMEGSKHNQSHFDICNESCCQVYLGTQSAGSNSDRAVDETAGVVATYEGEYIEAVYCSSNGGASEDSAVIWGGTHDYLVGVEDPYELSVEDEIDEAYSGSGGSYRWTKQYSGSELAQKLRETGYQCGTIVSARVSQYSDTGNPVSVTLTDSDGKDYTLNSRTFATSIVSLRSYRYDFGQAAGESGQLYVNGQPVDSLDGMYVVGADGKVSALDENAYVITADGTVPAGAAGGSATGEDGVITISGSGWGHNVGLSQWGAYAQAKEGRTYEEILKFYYTGITVG